MRILIILASMVTGSMATIVGNCNDAVTGDMIVFSGYANATKAGANYTDAAGVWAHADIQTVREIFTGLPLVTTLLSLDGGFNGVPWPLSTGGYNGTPKATSNSDFAYLIPFTPTVAGSVVALEDAICMRYTVAEFTGATSSSSACAAPELKFFEDASCTAGGSNQEIASPSAGAGFLAAAFVGNAGADITATGVGIYGTAQSGATTISGGSGAQYVAKAGYTQVEIRFHSASTCTSSNKVAASATAIYQQKMALFTNSDATTAAATVPGRCVNVQKDVSFEFYCNVPGGFITHIGYANNGCTGTPTTANTTVWGRSAESGGAHTAAEKCIAWKGVSNLYAVLANAAGTELTTNTLLEAVCPLTTTAAPTAAPASGAAAVGTAAAVAAGAAALIL